MHDIIFRKSFFIVFSAPLDIAARENHHAFTPENQNPYLSFDFRYENLKSL